MKKGAEGKGSGGPQAEEDPFFLWVHVKPKSSSDAILGLDEKGFLQVQLKALPDRGAANRGCCQLLSRAMNLPRSRIVLEKGHVSRHKKIRIQGISRSEGEIILNRVLNRD